MLGYLPGLPEIRKRENGRVSEEVVARWFAGVRHRICSRPEDPLTLAFAYGCVSAIPVGFSKYRSLNDANWKRCEWIGPLLSRDPRRNDPAREGGRLHPGRDDRVR